MRMKSGMMLKTQEKTPGTIQKKLLRTLGRKPRTSLEKHGIRQRMLLTLSKISQKKLMKTLKMMDPIQLSGAWTQNGTERYRIWRMVLDK